MLSALLCLALCPQGPNAPVVINEFAYDDTGTDDKEFIELYNATNAAIDISGWKVDSEDQSGPNTARIIPAATILPPGGFWVIGAPIVPNVNQVVIGTGVLENDQESITLRDASGAIIDTLVYEVAKGLWPNAITIPLREGDGIWGNHINSDGIEQSWSRVRDGWDTGNNGLDFVNVPWTPGASNSSAMTGGLPYADNYDSFLADVAVPDFGGSFQLAYAIDPTVPSVWNGNPIPASPQGGNALTCWDTAGGGNAGFLRRELPGNVVFEAWVYFDAVPEQLEPNTLTTEYETWSIGIGTTCGFYNTPDPSGYLTIGNSSANGNTGVSWTYQCTDLGGTLYLIDHNDGGYGTGTALTNATVIGSIPITVGVNDGWQRLRLERTANTVLGTFGGAFGSAGGQSLGAAIGYNGPATLYLGYREFLTTNAGGRPPTMDDVTIRVANSDILYVGSPSPTTLGSPAIGANSAPSIGNSAWQVTLASMVPSLPSVLFLGVFQQTIPLSVFGGNPVGNIYVIPNISVAVPTGVNGNAALPVPIPNNPTFIGQSVYWQGFCLDVNLPYAFKAGATRGMQTKFGN